jgi:hypothetical protein
MTGGRETKKRQDGGMTKEKNRPPRSAAATRIRQSGFLTFVRNDKPGKKPPRPFEAPLVPRGKQGKGSAAAARTKPEEWG